MNGKKLPPHANGGELAVHHPPEHGGAVEMPEEGGSDREDGLLAVFDPSYDIHRWRKSDHGGQSS